MALSRGELEYYHNIGMMPDWIYYQQNGDDIQLNYMRQKDSFYKKFLERKNE